MVDRATFLAFDDLRKQLAATTAILSAAEARLAEADAEKAAAPCAVSPSDPAIILAGIKQFGLAHDGSDLRDLGAAIEAENTRSAAEEKSLDEILFRFHCEVSRPTAEIVTAWIRAYPQYADDIQAHAAEMLDMESRADAETARAEVENVRLREALEPFAKLGSAADSTDRMERLIVGLVAEAMHREGSSRAELPDAIDAIRWFTGACLNARAALASKEEGGR